MTSDLFSESHAGNDHWFTVMLADLLPEWGEGHTKAEAVKDMAELIWHLHRDLHGEPDERLAEHLRYQRDFLCTLARAFGKHQ